MATTLRTVARSQVRRQKVRLALSAVGVGLAAFFLSVVLILTATALTSVRAGTAGFYSTADAVLEATGAHEPGSGGAWYLSRASVEALRKSPQVEGVWVAPKYKDVYLSTSEDPYDYGWHTNLLGLPPRAEDFPFPYEGKLATGPQEIMVSVYRAEEISLGDKIFLDSNGAEYTVTGFFDPGLEVSTYSNYTFVSQAHFEDFIAKKWPERSDGALDYSRVLVFLKGDPATAREALRADLSDRGLLRDAVLSSPEEQIEADIRSFTYGGEVLLYGLLSFVALALLVASCVIANTFRVITVQRSKELALLRVLGAKRLDVTKMLLVEAALLGFFSALVGVLLAYALALGVHVSVQMLAVSFNPLPGLIALAVCTLVTTLSALLPSLHAYRLSPLQALTTRPKSQEQKPGQLRLPLLLGFLLLGTGLALAFWGIHHRIIPLLVAGVFLTALAAVYVFPLLVAPLLARFTLSSAPTSPSYLARTNAAHSPTSTTSSARMIFLGAALLAALFTGYSTMYYSSAQEIQSRNIFGLSSEVQVESTEQALARAEALDRSPQLTAGAVFLPQAKVDLPLQGLEDGSTGTHLVQSVDTEALARVTGSSLILDRDTILVPRYFMESGLLTEGQTLTVTGTLTQQELTLRVTDAPGIWYPIISLETAHELSGSSVQTLPEHPVPVATYVAATDPLAAPAQVHDAQNAFRDITHASPETLGGAIPETTEMRERLRLFLFLVLGLLSVALLIALVGIANTQTLSSYQRRQNYALLRALGLSRKSLRQVISLETGLIAAPSLVLGIASGIGCALLLLQVFALEGLPLVYSINWSQMLAILPAGLAVAWLTALLPAVRSSRVSPVEALREAV